MDSLVAHVAVVENKIASGKSGKSSKRPWYHKPIKTNVSKLDSQKKEEARRVIQDIDLFEQKLKPRDVNLALFPELDREACRTRSTIFQPASNRQYIQTIRQRIIDDEEGRKLRTMRRKQVMVERLRAEEMLLKLQREESLVLDLMRQTVEEQRIAAHLMQTRLEKGQIIQNRVDRDIQYKEQREQEYRLALEKETQRLLQLKEEQFAEIERQQQLHKALLTETMSKKHEKHIQFCREMVYSILEFVIKIIEFRKLTDKDIPRKFLAEWKYLLMNEQPIESIARTDLECEIPEEAELGEVDEGNVEAELHRQNLLNSAEFMQYINYPHRWANISSKLDYDIIQEKNRILGNIIGRARHLIQPPPPPPTPEELPKAPIKIFLVGKQCSGKSTIAATLRDVFNFHIVVIQELIQEAIEDYEKNAPVKVQSVSSVDENQYSPIENLNDVDPEKIYQHVMGAATEITEEQEDDVTVNLENQIDDINSGEIVGYSSEDVPAKVTKAIISKSESDENLSERQKLGKQALRCIRAGEEIDDQTLCEIFLLGLKRIPDGRAWISDGFPFNLNQAKIVEHILTGCNHVDTEEQTDFELVMKASSGCQLERSVLMPDPTNRWEKLPLKSGFDAIICVDTPNKDAITRATNGAFAYKRELIKKGSNPSKIFTTTSRSPLGKREANKPMSSLVAGVDTIESQILFGEYSFAHLFQNFVCFCENWPVFKNWLQKFGVLRIVEGTADQDIMCRQAVKIVCDILQIEMPATHDPYCLRMFPNKTSPCPVHGELSRQEKKKSSHVKVINIRRPSRPATVGKRKGSKFSKRAAKQPQKQEIVYDEEAARRKLEEEELKRKQDREELVPIAPSPLPGPACMQTFVEFVLQTDIAEGIFIQWLMMEASYIVACKDIFNKLRNESKLSYGYLYNIQIDFISFLKRPDHKQEFVSQWQADFNSISEDMRNDEEVKNDLHHRLGNLLETLWEICDSRRNEAQDERAKIAASGWFNDNSAMITNYYTLLMQAEIDRFLNTIAIITDYYTSLRQHDLTEPLQVQEALFVSQLSCDDPKYPVPPNPPQSPTDDLTSTTSSSVSHTHSKKRGGTIETPPLDKNQRTTAQVFEEQQNVFLDAYEAANEIVAKCVLLEKENLVLKTQGLHANQHAYAAYQMPEMKDLTYVYAPSENNETDEILTEYIIVHSEEKERCQRQLSIIKEKATNELHDLYTRCECVFNEMRKLLEARYVRETQCIEVLSAVTGRAIEKGEPVQRELVMDRDNFFIDESILLYANPIPQPPPPPEEYEYYDRLTVRQLLTLANHFKQEAPDGFMSTCTFSAVLRNIASVTSPRPSLPKQWLESFDDVFRLLVSISNFKIGIADWRRSIISILQSYAPSLRDLLEVRDAFTKRDQNFTGFLSKAEYDSVILWFENSPPTKPEGFDVPRALKHALFDIFCDSHTQQLNYNQFLLHFSITGDREITLLKALSVLDPQFKLQPGHPVKYTTIKKILDYFDIYESSEIRKCYQKKADTTGDFLNHFKDNNNNTELQSKPVCDSEEKQIHDVCPELLPDHPFDVELQSVLFKLSSENRTLEIHDIYEMIKKTHPSSVDILPSV